MILDYEFTDPKLKAFVEKEAKKHKITVEEQIERYINRELMSDSMSEEVFEELHSQEYLDEVNKGLKLD